MAYNTYSFATHKIDCHMNSHEREAKVVYATDLITSKAIELNVVSSE
jgi:hypothetical protein